MRGSKARKLRVTEPATLKIDFGCGTRKEPGFYGVDVRAFEGVDLVLDIASAPWPWADNSVAEARASHLIEHLTNAQRCHFFNELYRVLAPGGTALIVTPHWASNRAYGDPTHVWPPVSEMAYFYLDAEWRQTQAPHVNEMLSCHFKASWAYQGHPSLEGRSQEYTTFALQHYKEVALDLIATVSKQPLPG